MPKSQNGQNDRKSADFDPRTSLTDLKTMILTKMCLSLIDPSKNCATNITPPLGSTPLRDFKVLMDLY